MSAVTVPAFLALVRCSSALSSALEKALSLMLDRSLKNSSISQAEFRARNCKPAALVPFATDQSVFCI